MKVQTSNSRRKRGASSFEAILFILLLLTLAFLALPIYNSCSLYRQSKNNAEDRGTEQTTPKAGPGSSNENSLQAGPNDLDSNSSKAVPGDLDRNASKGPS